MLSKNQRKQILLLKQKKYRIQKQLFVAEGEKVVQEFMDAGYEMHQLYATFSFQHPLCERISGEEMQQLTHFKTASPLLAVFSIPEETALAPSDLMIALDDINDPGNLGTFIRLCDWYGIQQLVCSPTTVDCYNPKTVQAAMGSLARVQCHYLDLAPWLQQSELPSYGAQLEGQNLYTSALRPKGVFVFGSESHGLSDAVRSEIDHFITIPRFNKVSGAESLNVAIAGAIVISELFRSSFPTQK